jgi:Family of unknown function (DUF6088)
MQSIEDKVKSRIYGRGRGWVFTPQNFLDLGGRSAIDVALSRLIKAEVIRSLARGLYDYPIQHPKMGALLPSADSIAEALAGNAKLRLQPSGAYAANLLGLSEQVPLKVVFLTDGSSRSIKVRNQEVILKKTTPKNMMAAGKISGLVIQALRYLGKDNIDDKSINKLQRKLTDKEKEQLLKDIKLATAWIAATIRKIAEPIRSE